MLQAMETYHTLEGVYYNCFSTIFFFLQENIRLDGGDRLRFQRPGFTLSRTKSLGREGRFLKNWRGKKALGML